MDLTDFAEPTEDAITRWAGEVNGLCDLVTEGQGNIFREAGFLPVGDPVAAKISTDAGLNVSGYEHIIDTSSLRHILKRHGTEAEYNRGQVPVTRQDLVQLPQLLLDPDTIEYVGKTKQGRDVICYTKQIGEHTVFYTEEMRTKKSRLAAVTLYKRKIGGNKG